MGDIGLDGAEDEHYEDQTDLAGQSEEEDPN